MYKRRSIFLCNSIIEREIDSPETFRRALSRSSTSYVKVLSYTHTPRRRCLYRTPRGVCVALLFCVAISHFVLFYFIFFPPTSPSPVGVGFSLNRDLVLSGSSLYLGRRQFAAQALRASTRGGVYEGHRELPRHFIDVGVP